MSTSAQRIMAIASGHAYVVLGSAGLRVVDVSDPSSPQVVASLDTPGDAADVAVVGGTAGPAAVIDELGTFVLEHQERIAIFGGARHAARSDRHEMAAAILPFLRGRLATVRRSIGAFDDAPETLEFVNARDAEPLGGRNDGWGCLAQA